MKRALLMLPAVIAGMLVLGVGQGSPGSSGPVTQDENKALGALAVVSDPDTLLTVVDGIQPFGITPEMLVADTTASLSDPAADPGTKLVDDDLVQCPKAQYMSIQDAVNAASPGGTIKVCPGTYHEHVDIDKPLRVIGDVTNPSSTIIDGSGLPEADDHVEIHDTSGVELAGFKVVHSHSNDAYIGFQRTTDNKVHHNLGVMTAADCGPLCFEPVGRVPLARVQSQRYLSQHGYWR